jgi:hypothetical protein
MSKFEMYETINSNWDKYMEFLYENYDPSVRSINNGNDAIIAFDEGYLAEEFVASLEASARRRAVS